MSMIRAKNTKPEMIVRKYLHAQGYRFRLYNKNLPGKPDIVLKKYGTVIFVNGCFWHGHYKCRYFTLPKTRRNWWQKKIDTNKIKDKTSRLKLVKGGWKVITVWECQLKPGKIEKTLNRIIAEISK